MANTLDPIREKIKRAKLKAREADIMCRKWFENHFEGSKAERDKQGRLVLRLTEVTPMPPEYALLTAEIAYHLRSALDHLVFPLAKPRSVAEENRIVFPLCSTRKLFDARKGTALRGVDRDVLKLVESVQPYHRRKCPEARFLGQLQALDNWNKHRALTIGRTYIVAIDLDIKVAGQGRIVRYEVFPGWVKPNMIIARLHAAGMGANSKVNCDPTAELAPVFDKVMPKGIAGVNVDNVIHGAGRFIEGTILPRFERFF